jgi:hypothetical protein
MMEKQKPEKITAKGMKGGKVIFVVCLVVIVALLGVVAWLLRKSGDDDTTKRDVVVNEKNAEEVASDFIEEERTPTGYYRVKMNSTWNFANGEAESDNGYVENATTNTNAVYFDVVRNDTGETIYKSAVIPVGEHLDKIKLDTSLEKGSYDCTLTYHLIDDEQETLSTLNMGLKIVIAE